MTASAAELRGGYDIARRDLPWRNPVSPRGRSWSVHASADSGGARAAIWLDRVAALAPSATAATSVADVLRAWGKPGSRGSAR
jgi:hypothetical protein